MSKLTQKQVDDFWEKALEISMQGWDALLRNERLAKAITEKVAAWCKEYTGYTGFDSINAKGEIYIRVKDVLDNGIEE